MASPISFQGLSTGLATDKLIQAIIDQESQPIQRMQDKQNLNTRRQSLLRTLSTNLTSLSTALSTLNTTSFAARAVSSTDANNTLVAASATDAASGSYDVTVAQVATKSRLAITETVASASTDLGGTADGDGLYNYTLTNHDGAATTFKLSAAQNTLTGLRDAINAQQTTTGVQASVVQIAASGNSFQLVLSSDQTGLGTAVGDDAKKIKFQVNAGSALDTGGGTTYASAVSEQAQNAVFTVNSIQVERTSNTVDDVVPGVTFSLRKGDNNTQTTTFTVGMDKDALTTALQGVVDKFNAAYKTFKDNSGTGQALAGDSSVREMLSRVRSAITLAPESLSAGNTFGSAASLGLKTNRDGTMSLDSTAFKAALDKDPSSAAEVFSKVGAAVSDLVSTFTLPGSGNIASILQVLDSQNLSLNNQISVLKNRLDRRRTLLEVQFSQLESTIGQMQSAGQSLGTLA